MVQRHKNRLDDEYYLGDMDMITPKDIIEKNLL